MRIKRILFLVFTFTMIYLGFTDFGRYRMNEYTNVTYFLNSSRAITVYVNENIDGRHIQLIRNSLKAFKLLHGIRVELTDNPSAANIVVHNWVNFQDDDIIGVQPVYTNDIFIDIGRIAATGDDGVFQSVFLHEFGHWLGMDHVCRFPEERFFYRCSRVGYGIAVMNRIIDYGAPIIYTDLDLLEFNRVNLIR